jgi:intracellular sulfur oxidation DsrE/DsrF family protein
MSGVNDNFMVDTTHEIRRFDRGVESYNKTSQKRLRALAREGDRVVADRSMDRHRRYFESTLAVKKLTYLACNIILAQGNITVVLKKITLVQRGITEVARKITLV